MGIRFMLLSLYLTKAFRQEILHNTNLHSLLSMSRAFCVSHELLCRGAPQVPAQLESLPAHSMSGFGDTASPPRKG